MSAPTSYQTRLIARTTIAEDTVAFELERPDDFTFEAGQYVSLQLPDFASTDEDDGERMLSIASTPHESRIVFAMRMRDTPFKRQLGACDIGATLLVSPAMGDFVLPDDATTPIVMIAGGIGITPFYSMLNTLRHRADRGVAVPPVTLVYGNRTPTAAAWREPLEQLIQTLPNFQLVHVYGDSDERTGATSDVNPRIRGGFITADVIKEIPGWRESHYFVVGPVAMVASMQDCLDDCGVPPEHVTIEFFPGY
ncbi:ferredoxin--NADP reductase [Burkholderia guangdongensis]|uniref:ferredoxin--NADP reductase n=1 Tax=Burkholderia guangdongensis TaxID=1792500 RepID=UPI0015C6A80E|nr:FAD-dependent oxidoreductase [Burkholderia guangdongensis]